MTQTADTRTGAALRPSDAAEHRSSQITQLWLIAISFVVVSTTLWGLGRAFGAPLISFAGLMTLASTFVPMPADAYVIAASLNLSALTIGLVGGGVSAVAVLGERAFLGRLMDFPVFEKVRRMVGTNKYIGALEDHMFFGLIVAAATPIPFEVFRFVACVRKYDWFRYALATFIGRGARFYALAKFGGLLAQNDLLPWVVAILIGFFLVGLVKSIVQIRLQDA